MQNNSTHLQGRRWDVNMRRRWTDWIFPCIIIFYSFDKKWMRRSNRIFRFLLVFDFILKVVFQSVLNCAYMIRMMWTDPNVFFYFMFDFYRFFFAFRQNPFDGAIDCVDETQNTAADPQPKQPANVCKQRFGRLRRIFSDLCELDFSIKDVQRDCVQVP